MNKPLSRETTRGRPHSRALALRHGAARRHKRAASASVFFGSGQEAPRGGAEHGRTGGGVSPRTSIRVLSNGARSAGPAGAATRLARTTGVAWQWSAYGWQWLATVGNGWQWLAMVGKGWQRLAMISNGWRWLAGWQWLAMVGKAGPGNGGVEDWLGSPLRRVTFGSARWWRGSAGGGTAGRGMAAGASPSALVGKAGLGNGGTATRHGKRRRSAERGRQAGQARHGWMARWRYAAQVAHRRYAARAGWQSTTAGATPGEAGGRHGGRHGEWHGGRLGKHGRRHGPLRLEHGTGR